MGSRSSSALPPPEDSLGTHEKPRLWEQSLIIQPSNISRGGTYGSNEESYFSRSLLEADRINGSAAHDDDNQPPKPPFLKLNGKRVWDPSVDDIHEAAQNSSNITWLLSPHAEELEYSEEVEYSEKLEYEEELEYAEELEWDTSFSAEGRLMVGSKDWPTMGISSVAAAAVWLCGNSDTERKKKRRRTSLPGKSSITNDQAHRLASPAPEIGKIDYYGLPSEPHASLRSRRRSKPRFLCRKDKQRCDRKEPSCSRCARFNYDCPQDQELPEGSKGHKHNSGSTAYPPGIYNIDCCVPSGIPLDELAPAVENIYQRLRQAERHCLEEGDRRHTFVDPCRVTPVMRDKQSKAMLGLHRCLAYLNDNISGVLRDCSDSPSSCAQYVDLMPLWRHLNSRMDVFLESLYSEDSLRQLLYLSEHKSPATEDTWLDYLAELPLFCRNISDEDERERRIRTDVALRWYHQEAQNFARDEEERLLLERPSPMAPNDESDEKTEESLLEDFPESLDGSELSYHGPEDKRDYESTNNSMKTSDEFQADTQGRGFSEMIGTLPFEDINDLLQPEITTRGQPNEIEEVVPMTFPNKYIPENNLALAKDVSSTADDDWLSSFTNLEKFSLDLSEYSPQATSCPNTLNEPESSTEQKLVKHLQLDHCNEIGNYIDPCLTVMSQWDLRKDTLQESNIIHKPIAHNPPRPAAGSQGQSVVCPDCSKSFPRPSDLR